MLLVLATTIGVIYLLPLGWSVLGSWLRPDDRIATQVARKRIETSTWLSAASAASMVSLLGDTESYEALHAACIQWTATAVGWGIYAWADAAPGGLGASRAVSLVSCGAMAFASPGEGPPRTLLPRRLGAR